MMMDKRLIGTVSESKKYIAGNVVVQWISLVANIVMMWSITALLAALYDGSYEKRKLLLTLLVMVAAALVRFVCVVASSKMSYLSSKAVKKTLRGKIYEKLLRLGSSYREHVQTSEVVQVAVEGCDQLETYFGAYLPQFFYAMIAPLTLFVVLLFVNVPAAVVLLVCVPLIPVSIALVQTWAKKLLSKYWGQYTALGDTFLENLQGLTTLKIYQADAYKNEQMNEESEKFRKITMKVLTMQLNSITIMDLIAYGGAALGVILAATQLRGGHVDVQGALLIILLSADFFLPMRQLGSYFHIAMNGMAASDKIFKLLELPEPSCGGAECPKEADIVCEGLSFAYQDAPDKDVIKDVTLHIEAGKLSALVGESGCGKSTVSAILMGRNKGYLGSVKIGDEELKDISEESLLRNFTYISHQSFLFKGSVKENLRMARPEATEAELWDVLEQVNLAEFLRNEEGLATKLTEGGGNFSGGQRQRLALARALLHDSGYYIFDEATSNIDAESEDIIMAQVRALAKQRTVLLISHRLANVAGADWIYVLDGGQVAEEGRHEDLLAQSGTYARLWNAQQELEQYGVEEACTPQREAVQTGGAKECSTAEEDAVNRKEVRADA